MNQEQLNPLLGKTEAEVREFAQANECILFVGNRDDKTYYKTMEYNPRRINVTVYSNIVREISLG